MVARRSASMSAPGRGCVKTLMFKVSWVFAVATGFSLTTRQSLIGGAAQMPQSSFFLSLLLISGLR